MTSSNKERISLLELESLWSEDCEVRDQLDSEYRKIPKLHSKYYTHFIRESLQQKKTKSDLDVLVKNKYMYYTGMMTSEELRELGWVPFGTKIMKTDAHMFIDGDKDVIKLKLELAVVDEKVSYLKSILQCVKDRSYVVNGILEWKKFEGGA